MPVLTFQPSGKTIDVPNGTELLDAARKAEIDIESPCGGKGTCGKCIVRIVSGETESDDLGILSESAVNRGYTLACKTKILDEPVTVEIPEQLDKTTGQFLDETNNTCLLTQNLLPKDFCADPLTIRIVLDVPSPQLEDGLSDLDRVIRAIQQKLGKKDVSYSLPIIRQTAEALRNENENGKVTVSLAQLPEQFHVVSIEPGDHTARHFGIAVDIGTTTIAVQLVSMTTAKVIATQTAYNDQIDCGLDVISRINYARKPDRLEDLRNRVLKTINSLIEQLCGGNEVAAHEIHNAVIAGNTTMIHLLLGLVPEYIRLEPYTPTLLKPPFLRAGDIGIDIHPLSMVYISPAVGSYVGGDITAGLLCTDMAAESEDINLFIDIGTNGELVIGNRDFLVTCACSAGPAFEGGGIDNGMRAAMGAVDNVEINRETGAASYRVIGNVPAKGICGTGMISLLANLFLTGWLDAAGKLNRERKCPAITVNGRQAYYTIVPAGESASGKPLTISETDIENIIRAKAAVYSAASLMLEQVGLGFDDFSNVYIAGGFGRFLDIEKAIVIGLLPDLEREKYRYIGNSSLMGAYLVLVSQEYRRRQVELAERMTYVELSTDPAYMHQYTGALFLPHTEIGRFPSLKKR
jgi:uncharacterized 2Fe-2S/4Fe-4S cluster protein (DUF4445 family)